MRPDEIVASDYDGTFNTHPEIRGEVDLIITGNSFEECSGVMEELGRTDIPVYFNTAQSGKEDLSNIVSHKSDIINKVGATKFFENQKEQVDLLKILCPKCKIVLVRPNQNYI